MIDIYWYDKSSRKVDVNVDLERLPSLINNDDGVLWVDFTDPVGNELELLTTAFYFHSLCVEDCYHEQAIAKLEEFPDYLFMVVHGVKPFNSGRYFKIVELDVFVGRNFLVTIHDEPLLSTDFLRTNLLRGTSSAEKGSVALAHEVLDALVDQYMPVVENLDARLQELEDELEKNPASNIISQFFDLRRAILELRRISVKQQEVFYWLSHRHIVMVPAEEMLLFRDIYDHLVRIVVLSDSSREVLSGILEIHLSLMSNRMNDIMRILTIFSAILFPLNFLTGFYGMNFDYLPALHNPLGHWIVLGFMAAIVALMLMYFRHKKWL